MVDREGDESVVNSYRNQYLQESRTPHIRIPWCDSISTECGKMKYCPTFIVRPACTPVYSVDSTAREGL